MKELKGFAKVDLKPGEIKRVSVKLDVHSFSFFHMKKHAWNAEPGNFNILVGSSSAKIELQDRFTLKPRQQ